MDQLMPFAQNLRVLLWREGLDREKWVLKVGQLAACSSERAQLLLTNASPSDDELRRIGDAIQRSAEDLAFGDLLEGTDLVVENLKFLFQTLEHGGQRELADAIGVDATTVSRWKAGGFRPNKGQLEKLREYFQLQSSKDLTDRPLFLSLDPVGGFAKRAWLLARVRETSVRELESLFPALKKLLGR